MESSLRDDTMEVQSPLSIKRQLSYGVGHVLNDVCASMWFTYLLVYFHLVQEFSNWDTGLMLLVGQVADAIATPFVGFHSDQGNNSWLCRYGRRKTWHLLGTICTIGSFPFIFSPCVGDCSNSHKWALMFYYCVFIIIFQFGWAAVQISHLSLIPELTTSESHRTRLTALRYCFTVVSNVLVYVLTWLLLHLDNGDDTRIGPKDASKFQIVVLSVMAFGTACSVLFHLGVQENDNFETNDGQRTLMRRSIKDLLSDLNVYLVAAVYMSSRLFVNLTQVFIPLYLHETLKMNASSLAKVPLIMFLGSFLALLSIESITKRGGRKITYCLGAALGLSACFWIKFDVNPNYIYGVAALIGSGGSIILVTSLGVTTDLIGDQTDSGALVFGIMSFTDKMANGIAVVVIQKQHNNSDDFSYYKNVLANVCGLTLLLGALFQLTIFKRQRTRLLAEPQPDYNSINT